jgi:oxygen-independent coproporphyrinogen-3 oxidase
MLSGSAALIRSLYVHVPFCARKCAYCAFYSEPTRGAPVDRFVRALVKELEMVAPGLVPVTVYFGGGTPSLLSLRQWKTILHAIERLRLLGAVEWTIECNPATVSLAKARLWRDYGVNRISLGVQSLAPRLLERLGRLHTRRQALDSFALLRRAGFENINLDLIFAIPGQTLAAWRATLKESLALGSEHLSCYELTYEEDTPFFIELGAGRHTRNEDLACAMYEELLEQAAAQGFAQYEVSNFAQRDPALLSEGVEIPALACRHNINYWRGGAYHGLGPSAAGYVGGVRTKNFANTERYCQALEAGRRAIEEEEILPPLRRAGETAAFGLRMNAGWPFEQFQRITGFDLRQDWQAEIATLLARGWAQADAHHLQLTGQGLRFADAAAELFLR